MKGEQPSTESSRDSLAGPVVCRRVFPVLVALEVPLSGAIAQSGCKAHARETDIGRNLHRVGLLESAAQMRSKPYVRLNMTTRPIANKYREGKLQRTLKREFKRA